MAKFVIINNNGESISIEASDAEATKLEVYNYNGGLSFVDDLGDSHNMNPASIADIIKKP